MFAKKQHVATVQDRSGTEMKNRRRWIPSVVTLEDRSLLSADGANLAAAAVNLHAPSLNQNAHTAEVHSVANQVARAERAAAPLIRTIHFPGGSVTINRKGTHVTFPGGSVRAGRFGAIVHFPGGSVVAGFGRTVVHFPGGSITV